MQWKECSSRFYKRKWGESYVNCLLLYQKVGQHGGELEYKVRPREGRRQAVNKLRERVTLYIVTGVRWHLFLFKEAIQ